MSEHVMTSKLKYRAEKRAKGQKATSSISGSKKKKGVGFSQKHIHRIPTLVLYAGRSKRRFEFP